MHQNHKIHPNKLATHTRNEKKANKQINHGYIEVKKRYHPENQEKKTKSKLQSSKVEQQIRN